VLSVHRLGAGSEGYYLDQVVAGVEDYYAGAGEAPGEWLASSGLLGMEGRVGPDDLRAVLLGVDPRSGDGLHHGSGRSVPGWDLTFRAPKSVSVLWGLADPEIAEVVVAAHEAAVKVGLRYVEEWAGFTRTGRGGATRVRADGLIAAGFRHRTSRDGDPHLHTHVLVANSVRAADGRWRTLDGRGLLVHMKTAGYVYDAQLRHELAQRLGVEWGPVVNGLADIDGIDAEVRELFSKRRSAIEDRMAEWGLTSANAAEVSALDTRQAKSGRVEHTDELRDRWRAETAGIGWTQRDLLAACPSASMVSSDHSGERSVVRGDHDTERAVVRADQPSDHLVDGAFEVMSSAAGLTAHASSFDRRHVIQHLVDHLPPGPPADWFEATADRYLQRAEVVALGSDPVKGECYSTVDLLDLEKRLVDQVAARRLGERSPEVMPSIVWSVFQERPSLSGEQRDLISGVCRTTDAVSVIVAGPGTGKTFCLDAIRDGFQRSGYTTTGCALSASAAHQLEQGSGIESMTIARLRLQLDHHERRLGPRSVLVIDEAGMVGTRDLAPLLDQAASAGAKVVLVGDPKQLPEIEAGGFLRHLARHHDVHTLSENRRQRVGWERDTISDLAHGRVDAALERMTANYGVVVGNNADLVRQRMADDWFEHRSSGASAVMMASRNSDVDDLNRRAHQLMADHGHLRGEPLHLDGRPFQIGDRVVCLRNDRRLDVRNGTVGDITHIDYRRRTLTMDTPDGTRRLPAEYLDAGQVRHGYAVTIHKAQGITCDHALLLGSDELYRESGYVGLSRGRESNRIYAVSTAPDPEAHIPKHLRKEREPRDVLTNALEQTRAQRLGIDHDAEPDVEVGW
jgi:conjugative relaxase-like TrwC/TraI family protein